MAGKRAFLQTDSPQTSQGGQPAVVWLRQDLRLADNPALHAAAAAGRPVLPVYILDEAAAGRWRMGGAHRWWLHHSLAALAADLAHLGAPLVLRQGDAASIIAELARAVGAREVHAGALVEPWARRQADAVARALDDGSTLVLHRASTLLDMDAVRTKSGGVYGVYTPFARACRAMGPPPEPLPAPPRLTGVSAPSDHLDDWALRPTHPDWAGGMRDTWTPGAKGGHARLQRFMAGAIDDYADGRNTPGQDLTSMLSPHLHWGELSPAQVWHAAANAGSGEALARFHAELLWHEFAAYLLWHHPHLPEQPLRPDYARLQWRSDAAGLRAWQRGQTGVPIVDAGMRQLWHIGWMHNRVRMITASFLVKHLLVSWVDGEAWFWDTLVDGDLAANAASWQWIAGSGTDSQPFFRVFNPVTQGAKFDADGAYVRRWVPELARLPDRHLHAPWDAPAEVLAAAGVRLGTDYPHPIVALGAGRDRALAAFKAMRAAA
jgi:deoxyribodipyrimidine photo-lyase